jgi:hypothetical protein
MSSAVSWKSRETAATAFETSSAGAEGRVGVIGASAIALAPTNATPVVNHGRRETSMQVIDARYPAATPQRRGFEIIDEYVNEVNGSDGRDGAHTTAKVT